MTRYFKIKVASSFLFFIILFCSIVAHAGEYHAIKEKTYGKATETLACSQCHTMHASQGSTSLIYSGGGTGPQLKLLRFNSIMGLCLFCHDNNKAGFSCTAGTPCPPDVWSGIATYFNNNSAGLLCSGGTTPASPPCIGGTPDRSTQNHTVDANPAAPLTPPGSSGISFSAATGGFTCVNCHSPHGTYSFRNLRDNGTKYPPASGTAPTFMAVGETVTYFMGAAGSNTVHVNNLVSAGYGLAKYQTTNVVFKLIPTIATRGIQGFCRSCHANFHGIPGDANMSSGAGTIGDDLAAPNPWLRHPTTTRDMASADADTHADNTCWTTGSSAECAQAFTPGSSGTSNRVIDPNGTTAANTGTAVPFCLSCHRAHGSSRHSNLIFGPPTTVGGTGTMMRDTCQQCHNQ